MFDQELLFKFYGLEVGARRNVYLTDGRILTGEIGGHLTTSAGNSLTLQAFQLRVDDAVVAIPISGVTSIEASS